jgi:hypothetical protein
MTITPGYTKNRTVPGAIGETGSCARPHSEMGDLVPRQATFALSSIGTSGRCPMSICPRVRRHHVAHGERPERSICVPTNRMGRRRGSRSALGAAPFPRVVLCAVLGRGERSWTGWRGPRLGAVPERRARHGVKERQASGVDHELDPVACLDPDPGWALWRRGCRCLRLGRRGAGRCHVGGRCLPRARSECLIGCLPPGWRPRG